MWGFEARCSPEWSFAIDPFAHILPPLLALSQLSFAVIHRHGTLGAFIRLNARFVSAALNFSSYLTTSM